MANQGGTGRVAVTRTARSPVTAPVANGPGVALATGETEQQQTCRVTRLGGRRLNECAAPNSICSIQSNTTSFEWAGCQTRACDFILTQSDAVLGHPPSADAIHVILNKTFDGVKTESQPPNLRSKVQE